MGIHEISRTDEFTITYFCGDIHLIPTPPSFSTHTFDVLICSNILLICSNYFKFAVTEFNFAATLFYLQQRFIICSNLLICSMSLEGHRTTATKMSN